MSDVYLDSSFLLKLYLSESDSWIVDAILQSLTGQAFVTKLTDVEVVSSLQRRLPSADGMLAAKTYLANRESGIFSEVALSEKVFETALGVAHRYAKLYKLKSLDILHLATALRYGMPSVCTFDRNMREAAVGLGLRVLPA